MAFHARKNIITDSLVFETDAANKLCKFDSDTVGFYATNFINQENLEVQLDTIFNFGDTDFTIVAWVRRNVGTGTITAFAKSNGAVANYQLLSAAGNWEWRVSSDGLAGGRTILNFGATSLGTWQHVVLVNDSTNNEIRAYLDGVESIAPHTEGSNISTLHPFTVGDRHFNSITNAFVDGDIDNVSVYDKAFVQADATTSFNGGVRLQYPAVDQVNLLSHYTLDEPNGSVRIDSHGSNDMIENGGGGVDNGSESALVALNLVNPVEQGTPINGVDLLQDTWILNGIDQRINYGNILSDVIFNDSTKEFSISFWAKFDNVLVFSSVVCYSFGVTNAVYIYIGGGRKLTFTLFATGELRKTSTSTLVNNNWYNVVVTKGVGTSANTAKIYINGVDDLAANSLDGWSGNAGVANGEFLLGARKTGAALWDGHVDGMLSNIKVYPRELTPPEIENNYNALKHRFN